jgi:hypothetical protein
MKKEGVRGGLDDDRKGGKQMERPGTRYICGLASPTKTGIQRGGQTRCKVWYERASTNLYRWSNPEQDKNRFASGITVICPRNLGFIFHRSMLCRQICVPESYLTLIGHHNALSFKHTDSSVEIISVSPSQAIPRFNVQP